jgi:hypothetical protein
MKKLFLIIVFFLITSCAEVASINIINSMLTPSSMLISSVTNYGLDRYTGRQGSEHVLSLVTGQDCKFKMDIKNICKTPVYFY